MDFYLKVHFPCSESQVIFFLKEFAKAVSHPSAVREEVSFFLCLYIFDLV